MGGNSLFQFLFQEYHDTLVATAQQQVNTILGMITPWVQLALSFAIVIFGKNTMMGRMSADEATTRIARVVIVVMLLTPANYNQYITQNVTHAIPDAITQAVSGQADLTGAQGFENLNAAVIKFAAQVRGQAEGIWYISERISVFIASCLARLGILVCFVIWMLAQAAAGFLVPLGALLIPFYIFDATREFTMRWVGKLISLFLVMTVSLMLGAFVVKQDAAYMQQYGQTIAANAANPNFQMNSGDLTYTGAQGSAIGAGADVPGLGAPAPNAQATANVDASIDMLWNVVLAFAFGAFLMLIMVGIALFIGGSSGFTAAPAFTVMSFVAARGAGRAVSAAVSRASGRRARTA